MTLVFTKSQGAFINIVLSPLINFNTLSRLISSCQGTDGRTEGQTDRQAALRHSELIDWFSDLQLLTFENHLHDMTNLELCGQSKLGHGWD